MSQIQVKKPRNSKPKKLKPRQEKKLKGGYHSGGVNVVAEGSVKFIKNS